MSISIHEIAQATGVSIATVSRAFSQEHKVNPETRERIIRISRELGYRPKKRNKKRRIVILLESKDPNDEIYLGGYLGLLMVNLYHEIFARGYSLELISSQNITQLNTSLVVGIISLEYVNSITCDRLNEFNIPIVNINGLASRGENIYSVRSNDIQGIKLAFATLHDAGHRKIGLLTTGNIDNFNTKKRIEGYIEALKGNNIPYNPKYHCHFRENEYFEVVGKSLRNGITGIICAGESIGLRVIYALNLFGKNIPDDISIVSFEFKGISQFLNPPQTSVSQNFAELSKKSLDIIEKYEHIDANKTISVDYKLILRESVASCRDL